MFLCVELGDPPPPGQDFMGLYQNATPLLYDCRFDMTKKTPPSQTVMGAYSHTAPPLLKAIFFDYRFNLTKKTPPGQNFMDAFHHVTPVLNDILDLCRFDLM